MATIITGCSFYNGNDSKEVNALPFTDSEWNSSSGTNSSEEFNQIALFLENADNPDLGTLYLQKGTNAQEKISDSVRKTDSIYLYNRKAVVFLDAENDLYIIEEGKDKIKIASDVFPGSIVISEDESTLAFLCTKSPQVDSQFPADLYKVKIEKEREKISSNVAYLDYALSYDGSVIAFRSNTLDLYIKKDTENEKEKIASSVVSFIMSGKGNAVIYQKDTDGLYYYQSADSKEDSSDSEKVYTGKAGLMQISFNGDTFCYLADYYKNEENSKGELYLVKPGVEPIKISSDILQYTLSPDGEKIYYNNEDNALYAFEVPEMKKSTEKNIARFMEAMKTQEKQKLGDDITSYITTKDGDTIAWANTDFDLYCFESGNEKQKLAPNIETFSISQNSVIFLNKDKELQSISKADVKVPFDASTKEKIATDVMGYSTSPYCKYVTYVTTSGELYHLTSGSQPVMLSDKINDFDFTYFMNAELYEKKVQTKDIEGAWKCEANDNVMQIKDNQIIFYNEEGKTETKITVLEAKRKEISFSEDGIPEGSVIEITDKDNIVYHYGEGLEGTYQRMSQEEYNKAVTRLENKAKEIKEAQAKKDAATQEALEVLSNKVLSVEKGTNIYADHSLTSQNYMPMSETYTFRITDYYVDDNANIWIYVEDDYYEVCFWFIYKKAVSV